MKILIADDHSVVRRGLRLILAEAYAHAKIVEVADSADLLTEVVKDDWDVIICDISMPGRSGAEILKEVRKLAPNSPVLILSTHSPEQYAIRTMKAGAAGYLTKESAPEELVRAIELVIHGKKYLTPEVADMIAESISDYHQEDLHKKLSDREFDVLKLLVKGKAIAEIASLLSISKNSISANRARILKKLQLQTNADLIRYAIEKRIWLE